MVLATLDSIRADHIGPPPMDRSDWTSITTVAQGTGGGRDPGGTRKQNSLVEIVETSSRSQASSKCSKHSSSTHL